VKVVCDTSDGYAAEWTLEVSRQDGGGLVFSVCPEKRMLFEFSDFVISAGELLLMYMK
jgi:hypothetical protein